MEVFKAGLLAASDSGRPDPEEVERAKAWIREFGRPLKNLNYNVKSYTLKHYVERWWRKTVGGEDYVSNGALTQAALELGYRAQPVGELGDALFNMGLPRKWSAARERAGFLDLPAPRDIRF